MKLPWTHEELEELRRDLDAKLEITESENPDARPLPPMDEAECKELLLTLTKSLPQAFLFGQLLAQYRQSIEARMLGKRGRYFVIPEAEIDRMLKGQKR